jgi:uncharacterized protein (TIGR02996 family)
MSTESALLRAIRDMPDEDTPRLMYADYLDENATTDAQQAQAEFIRVQIERSQLPEGDPRRNALEDRAHELLAEHECSWVGVAPDDMEELTDWRFERGFVTEVAATPVFMRGPGADLCAAHPIRRWRVTSGDTGTNFPEDLKEAGQRGWAARLEAVDLTGWYSGLGELSGFLGKRSNFERIRELNLIGRGPLEPLAEIIENAPFRDQLRNLRCGQGGYDGWPLDVPEFVRALGTACRLETLGVPAAMLMIDAARDLLAANVLSSLTSLDLSYNQIDADASDAFQRARFRLRELDLSGTPLGGAALDDLLGYPSLRELRVLRLNRCGNTAGNIRELAASPFWTQAEELHMQMGMGQMGMEWNEELAEDEVPAEADPASLTPLFNAAGPKNLRVLDLAGNGLRDPGVELLCAAKWAEPLTYLDLSQNYLSDEALRTLAKCGRFKNLRTLHLNFNSAYYQYEAAGNEMVTDAGLRALADCPDFANLRVLSISGTRITAAGVEAVLNSPHWRLTELRIAQCQLRPDVIDVLCESPRLARLEVLDLNGNDEIGLGRLKPLADSEYLSPQTRLDVRGLGGEATKVRTALRDRLGHRLTV